MPRLQKFQVCDSQQGIFVVVSQGYTGHRDGDSPFLAILTLDV